LRLAALFRLDGTPTSDLFTLSLHDALPISQAVAESGVLRRQALATVELQRRRIAVDAHRHAAVRGVQRRGDTAPRLQHQAVVEADRKSTRLNSSHVKISYAVFCLKKKKTIK